MVKKIDVNGTQYRVVDSLGGGGQGTVCLVDLRGKHYAIKTIMLHDEKKIEGKRRNERFREEVEYCKKFHSPHIIEIISSEEKVVVERKNGKSKKLSFLLQCAFGRVVEGKSTKRKMLQYVMPYFKHTLRELISEGLPIEQKFDLLDQLYDAVSVIHADGVVHRDIKPENILVDPERPRLVLADFGIAHFDGSGKTQAEELLANRAYFAPEQMRGKDQKDVGPAADVFALGLITNELFTLNIPRGTVFKRIGNVYPLLSELDNLVKRMTYQNPNDRILIGPAKSELKQIACMYRDSLIAVENHLRELCSPNWQTRLVDIKQNALDWEIAEEVLRHMSQKEVDEYADDYIGNSQKKLDSVLGRSTLSSIRYLVSNDRHKYSCENILHLQTEQKLQSIESKIYRQAAEEVVLANNFLRALSVEQWQSLNLDYHHNIRFSPDEDLLHAAQSVYFLEKCRKKFEYESNTYQRVNGPNWNSCYGIGPNEEQRAQLDAWLSERCFCLEPIASSKRVHGAIRKYFISCCDYHCTELIKVMKDAEQPWHGAFFSEESAIRLSYVIALQIASVVHPNEDPRLLMDAFKLCEHVELADVIGWPPEAFFERNEYARSLEIGPAWDAEGAKEILENLAAQYSSVDFEIRDDKAIVNFTDLNQHDCFSRNARKTAEGHYILEADTEDILRPNFVVEGLVRYIWSLGFDVKVTLAKVLGLQDIE